MTANGSPWSFHFHVVAWLVVVAIAVTYLVAVRRPGYAVTGRQAWSFVGGLVALLLALTWPVADLATHWLLLALVLQRLVLMLAVPPLLMGGLPQPLVAASPGPPRSTRPPGSSTAPRWPSPSSPSSPSGR